MTVDSTILATGPMLRRLKPVLPVTVPVSGAAQRRVSSGRMQ